MLQPRALVSSLLLAASVAAQAPPDPIAALEAHLRLGHAARPALGEQEFAAVALTESQARRARELLVADLAARLSSRREAEWREKCVVAGDDRMRFEHRVFGKAPAGKRRLFLSMHGGGGAPEEVNDQQWRNQVGLYEPKEGVYLAPRAPTDTWNMWHRGHIDALLVRIIEDAMLFEGVDPDRVYLMGYSAGGDGVYQVAPRLADRFAAAAMMAGHPNETRPTGLRNLPFTLHMGGDDAAYRRNAIAREWKTSLAALREADPSGYPHEVVLHEGKGHWMDREDAVAVAWMSKFERRGRPDRVVWRQDDVLHDRFYWLGMPEGVRKAGAEAHVRLDGNRVVIEKGTDVAALTIYLDDDLVDLDRPVIVVRANEPDDERTPTRTVATIVETLRMDPAGVFFARLDVRLD